MNYSTLISAIDETERFLKRAKLLAKYHKNISTNETVKVPREAMYDNPKEQGAVRRSSMDLTRVLADLRRGR